ncbi:MAG: SAF domain-containing protein [Anaerovoracaceae bacterium]
MKNKKAIIGMILIVITIGGIIGWEFWAREALTYDSVLVLTENVQKNTAIKKEMLAIKKIPQKSEAALTEQDIEQVVGKEARQFVPGETELFGEFFDNQDLVLNEDQYVFSVPNEWLKSYPQTLRRGDRAFLYAVPNYGASGASMFVTEATVAYAKDSSNTEVQSKDEERLDGSSSVSLVEVIVDKEQTEQITNYAAENYRFVILYR